MAASGRRVRLRHREGPVQPRPVLAGEHDAAPARGAAFARRVIRHSSVASERVTAIEAGTRRPARNRWGLEDPAMKDTRTASVLAWLAVGSVAAGALIWLPNRRRAEEDLARAAQFAQADAALRV